MSVSENENFMSRWSRRKQEVALDNETTPSQTVEESLKKEQQVVPKKTPEEIREEKLAELNALTDEDMPDVETLGEDSDYTGFMSVNVSESLRKIALQKLFHGKSYNIRDGLDEYDGDYTSFEKLDPSVITADMKHMIDVEAKKLLAKEEEDGLDDDILEQDELDVASSDMDSEVEELDDELLGDEVEVASHQNDSEEEIASVVDSTESDSIEVLALEESNNDEYLSREQSINNNNVTDKDIA